MKCIRPTLAAALVAVRHFDADILKMEIKMTKFLDKKFTVGLTGSKYSNGWDAIFGKKDNIPPHENADAHEVVMTFLNNATPDEIAKTAERAGIYNSNGELTVAYGGSAPSDAPPIMQFVDKWAIDTHLETAPDDCKCSFCEAETYLDEADDKYFKNLELNKSCEHREEDSVSISKWNFWCQNCGSISTISSEPPQITWQLPKRIY